MTESPKGAKRARKCEKRARRKRDASAQRRSNVDSNWLKPEACAEDIGVTKQHIYDLIGAGKLRAKRFSAKVIRVARTEWERFKTAAPDVSPAA